MKLKIFISFPCKTILLCCGEEKNVDKILHPSTDRMLVIKGPGCSKFLRTAKTASSVWAEPLYNI